jgi:hypothetical protein
MVQISNGAFMFSIKILAISLLALSLSGGEPLPGCRSQGSSNSNKPMPRTPTENQPTRGLKTLAEGFHSPIETPYVAIIRDSETYTALQDAGNLPALGAEFFKSNVVIAAFAGTRNTGGYSVAIDRAADGQISVTENSPAKDAMVPQVITSPFKVVSLETGSEPISVSVAKRFEQGSQTYRVTKGTFSISGGIAGRTQTYSLAGELHVYRLGDLVTVHFSLSGQDGQRERALRGLATGRVKNREFIIERMGHGSLLDPPSGELRITGKFAESNKLILGLDSGRVPVPDGYSGKGSVEAELVK